MILAEAQPDLAAREKETAPEARETTQLPTTQRASTARASTVQAPATSHPHRDVQPGHHETPAPDQPGSHILSVEVGSPTTERAAEDGASSQLPAGEGSGVRGLCVSWDIGWPLVPGTWQA